MKTCFELLLDVNPGASIQLDGAARLIRKCHNSTLEIHHVCHVRSKLSHVAVTVSITLQYLNGPEVYHFAQEKYFFFNERKVGTRKILNEKISSLLHNKLILWRPFPLFWGKFAWFPMKLTPLPYHFFRAFYFIMNFAPLRTMELSGSGFRIKNWSLHVELRFSRVECRSPSKICSFSFFRIWSAIAQQITRDLCKYCTSFGVFIRLELDVQLHFDFPPIWGKGTKFSSVPSKIMAMDVPTYACIKLN